MDRDGTHTRVQTLCDHPSHFTKAAVPFRVAVPFCATPVVHKSPGFAAPVSALGDALCSILVGGCGVGHGLDSRHQRLVVMTPLLFEEESAQSSAHFSTELSFLLCIGFAEREDDTGVETFIYKNDFPHPTESPLLSGFSGSLKSMAPISLPPQSHLGECLHCSPLG